MKRNGFVKMNSYDGREVWYEFRKGEMHRDGLRAEYRVIGQGDDTNFTCTGFFSWKDYGLSPDWYILELHFTS